MGSCEPTFGFGDFFKYDEDAFVLILAVDCAEFPDFIIEFVQKFYQLRIKMWPTSGSDFLNKSGPSFSRVDVWIAIHHGVKKVAAG